MTGWTPDPVSAARTLLGDGDGRRILGLAGPPGAGKSTLAETLADGLDAAALLPMDGYHLDDVILEARGDRPRKGAPHTFDVAGLVALLHRLRREETVFAPLFDRDRELSRAAAIEIGPEVKTVVLEGNWLLHDRNGWEDVRPALDACLYLDVPEEELRRRLRARWESYGLTEDEIAWKLDGNDLPNARLAAEGLARADLVVHFA